MQLKAAISNKTNDEPKIKLTQYGAEITFEVANVSIDELRSYTNCELELEIRK